MPITKNAVLTRRLLFGLGLPRKTVAQKGPSGIRPVSHAVPVFDGDELGWFQGLSGVIDIDLPEGERLELACIPEGTGLIGAEGADTPRVRATPIRQVRIDSFYMGRTEVTVGQYLAVLRLPRVNREMRNQYSFLTLNDENRRWPVAEGISHQDATEFCERVTRYSGQRVRLPSEAEWEYACRAGTTTGYYFGDRHDSSVVVTQRFSTVASKPPNRYGLYDMHGLSVEWCEDWFHADYVGAPLDGRPWRGEQGGDETYRMMRGDVIGPSTLPRPDSARRTWGQTRGWTSLMSFRVAMDGPHGVRTPTIVELRPLARAHDMKSAAPGQLICVRFAGGPVPASPRAFVDLQELTVLEASGNLMVTQFPEAAAPGVRYRFVLALDLQSSLPSSIVAARKNPGLFAGEDKTAAALNEGSEANSLMNPIGGGKVVSLFGDGFGQTGFDRLAVTLAGVPQPIESAGAAPGLPKGVSQVNVRISERGPSGALPVQIIDDGLASAADVLLHVSR